MGEVCSGGGDSRVEDGGGHIVDSVDGLRSSSTDHSGGGSSSMEGNGLGTGGNHRGSGNNSGLGRGIKGDGRGTSLTIIGHSSLEAILLVGSVGDQAKAAIRISNRV